MAAEPRDQRYVSYDRWDAEHARLLDQIRELKEHYEEIDRRLDARSVRQWQLMLAVISSLVLPLVIIAITAVTTARSP